MHLGKRAKSLNYHLNSEPETTRSIQNRALEKGKKVGWAESRDGGEEKRQGDKGGEGWVARKAVVEESGRLGCF